VPGIEPGTSSLSGTRSNQLSYTPYFARRLRLALRRASPDPQPACHPKPKSALGGRRAKDGGGNRARTGGPELAKLVLYQLSYAPCFVPVSRFIAGPARCVHPPVCPPTTQAPIPQRRPKRARGRITLAAHCSEIVRGSSLVLLCGETRRHFGPGAVRFARHALV
jgi:hypothetical protein